MGFFDNLMQYFLFMEAMLYAQGLLKYTYQNLNYAQIFRCAHKWFTFLTVQKKSQM